MEPKRAKSDNILPGLLWDDLGRHMLIEASHSNSNRRFTYASSCARWSKAEGIAPYRVDPDHLDKLVLATVSGLVSDRRRLREALKRFVINEEELDRCAARGTQAARFLEVSPPEWQKDILAALLSRVEIGLMAVTLLFRVAELQRFLSWPGDCPFRGRVADRACNTARYELKLDVSVVLPKIWPVLQLGPSRVASPGKRDDALIKLLARARYAQRIFDKNRTASIRGLAKRLNSGPLMFMRLLRLNYLAPDIIAAILDGVQPSSLKASDLLDANFPMDWAVQRKLLGFELPKRKLESHPFSQYGRLAVKRKRGHPVLDMIPSGQ